MSRIPVRETMLHDQLVQALDSLRSFAVLATPDARRFANQLAGEINTTLTQHAAPRVAFGEEIEALAGRTAKALDALGVRNVRLRIDSDAESPMEAVLVAYQQVPQFDMDSSRRELRQSLAEERLALVRIGPLTLDKEFDILSAARDRLNEAGYAALADRIDGGQPKLDLRDGRIDMREALLQGRVFVLPNETRHLSAADVVDEAGRESLSYFEYAIPDEETFAAIQRASAQTDARAGLAVPGRWAIVDAAGRRDPGYGNELADREWGSPRAVHGVAAPIELGTAAACCLWERLDRDRMAALLLSAARQYQPVPPATAELDTVRDSDELDLAL